ncbi:MAG: TIGR00730 family Rossman fold protein [Bryobacteraceae bacterium]
MPNPLRTVCVYCASSERTPALYHDAATRLGRHLAGEGFGIVYGGGATGSMGRVANAALAAGGKVTGVVPRFMDDLEWGHRSLSELHVVDDMHQRKRLMLELSDAAVALPGGCGTFEELLEAITWKRLGLFLGPIAIVNVNGFYDPLADLLARSIAERFMDERHAAMWSVVSQPEEVAGALRSAPAWSAAARAFAVPR